MRALAQPTPAARLGLHRCGRVALAAILLLGCAALYTRAHAQVSVALQSSPELTADHNKPCIDGPRAAYVQYRFQNTGASSLSGVGVTLSGFAGGIALAGGQAATLYLPTLAPGAAADLYWYVTYPCALGTTATLTATATSSGGAMLGTGSALHTVVGIQSAASGGSMVSQELIGHVVGGITYIDVVYSFTGADVGNRYLMQVAGYASFRADCFQLVGTLITASDIPTIQVGDVDRTSYVATSKTTGNTYSVTVRFSFRIQCLGTSSSTSPYAVEGKSTQIKYQGTFVNAGDPGTVVPGPAPVIPPPVNPFVVAKDGAPDSLGAGGIATFTVVVGNSSAQVASFDSIVDTLRAGLAFAAIGAASEIHAANSSALPAAGATGRIVFRSIPGTGYAVPAGGTLTLVYTVNVQDVEGWYGNVATMYAGLSAAGSDTDSVQVRFPVVIGVAPDGVTPAVRRVPGGGWSQQFTVTNVTRRAGEGFDLLFAIDQSPGVVAVLDSISGAGIVPAIAGDSARVPAWPASTARTYTLWYHMTPGDTGAQNVLRLAARSVTFPVVRDTGWAEVRRGAPLLTLVKAASASTVYPGTDVEYTIAFTNAGTFDARGTVVTDSIPQQLAFKIASDLVTLPSGLTAGMEYSADHGATWVYSPVSGGCGAPAGYDHCVTRIRLSVGGDLAPNSAGFGSLRFTARVR